MENESLWGNSGEQEITHAPAEQNVQPVDTQSNVSGTVSDVDNQEVGNKPTAQESFQAIRSRADKLQKERDEAIQTIRRIEEYALQQQQVKQPEPAPEPEYEDDDYIEGKHFKSEINSLKKELNAFKQQHQSNSIEAQLRNKYNDFEKVMTYENIAKLRELRPEIASTLHQSTDLYNKAAATYTILKEMGIHQDNTYYPEKERVEQNIMKPRVASSLQKTESALTHVSEFSNGSLSENRKKEIWATMQRNAR